MNKQEFEARIGKEIKQADYDVVEHVYTWHPIISSATGKDQIADIYNLPGGMRIIRDMVSTADKAKDIEDRRSVVRARTEELKREMAELNEAMMKLQV